MVRAAPVSPSQQGPKPQIIGPRFTGDHFYLVVFQFRYRHVLVYRTYLHDLSRTMTGLWSLVYYMTAHMFGPLSY